MQYNFSFFADRFGVVGDPDCFWFRFCLEDTLFTEWENTVVVDGAADDFLLLLPVRTSSCLLRSNLVLAANSSLTSFCCNKIG